MKALFGSILAAVIILATPASAQECNTIESGLITASDGSTVTTGFDDWGYNYNAHMFNGFYCDSYRNAEWCQPFADIELVMKWNDAWLSNKDCNGDGKLDRPSYRGSGAWVTNHQSGIVTVNGKAKRWTYFSKIVAVPADAVLDGTVFKTADGAIIGEAIWGDFAIVEQVSNDPSLGEHGRLRADHVNPGLGNR